MFYFLEFLFALVFSFLVFVIFFKLNSHNLAQGRYYSSSNSVSKSVNYMKKLGPNIEKNEQVVSKDEEILEEHEIERKPSEKIDDDWEGVERSDLEKLFGDAVVFVDSIKNVDYELKLQFYGLHKIATQGPCYGSKPMPFKISACKKWCSWHRLGDISREKAMEKYVALLSDRVADWKIDKTNVTYKRIPQDVGTCKDSWYFCRQLSQ